MTSGAFTLLPISSITVNRDERQRRELRGIEELQASIADTGLINPIVVTRDNVLVAGERRLTACRNLGFFEIPVQFTDEIDQQRLHLIELEENVRRLDLTWIEQNDAIARYHQIQKERDDEWTMEDSSKALGMTSTVLGKHLTIARARVRSPELAVDKAENLSTAYGLALRSQERQKSAVLQDALGIAPPDLPELEEPVTETLPSTEPPKKKRAALLWEDFLNFTPRAEYNFIHCDFPYGVNTGDKSGQSAAKRLGAYEDGEHIYWRLLEELVSKPGLVAAEAHIMFWFSMKFYQPTMDALTAGGWNMDPFPLIWHKSDNAGMLPDTNRGPRRVYETALFGSRGDRKIVRPVSNTISSPTTKTFHTSEKPKAVLDHFFRMFVDGSTRMLDPTCGSGMAIRACVDAGGKALGLEKEEEFYLNARRNCSL